jgi:hypothetical protein
MKYRKTAHQSQKKRAAHLHAAQPDIEFGKIYQELSIITSSTIFLLHFFRKSDWESGGESCHPR